MKDTNNNYYVPMQFIKSNHQNTFDIFPSYLLVGGLWL